MRHVSILAICLAVAGCSSVAGTHPLDSSPNLPVTVGEIQNAIGCEFYYALQNTRNLPRGHSQLENWGAIVELHLGVKDEINIVPGMGDVTAKVGNATLKATSPSATFGRDVEDKNGIAYKIDLRTFDSKPDCPRQNSQTASSGLGLSDFLVGTAQILDSGAKLTSTTNVPAYSPQQAAATVVANATTPAAPPKREPIPTVRYHRTFGVVRKLGGGLSFSVGDVSLTLTGTGLARTRTDADNTVDIILGDSVANDTNLLDAVWKDRAEQYDLLTKLPPTQIVVVSPATQ